MTIDLVSLLVALLVLGLVYWVGMLIIRHFGLPHPVALVFQVVIAIVAVLYLLSSLGLWHGGTTVRVGDISRPAWIAPA